MLLETEKGERNLEIGLCFVNRIVVFFKVQESFLQMFQKKNAPQMSDTLGEISRILNQTA